MSELCRCFRVCVALPWKRTFPDLLLEAHLAHRWLCFGLEQQWDASWDWFYQQPAAVHMFSENATEEFPAHGTFNFDQGYPSP